jgi:hypothetical protein
MKSPSGWMRTGSGRRAAFFSSIIGDILQTNGIFIPNSQTFRQKIAFQLQRGRQATRTAHVTLAALHECDKYGTA